MKIKKITTGFVVQVFDTDTNKWESQEFVAGDSEYETEEGEALGAWDDNPAEDNYLPFDMKQPEQMKAEGWEL